ncbi:hypothetical protein TeGR_g8979, partial [Tetraparma gracilis]
ALSLPPPSLAAAVEGSAVDCYFGCGCFWHVQHDLSVAEASALPRSPLQLTARAAYAGGEGLGKGGAVCYHNLAGVADYGKLGHAEVVSFEALPPRAFASVAEAFFGLFDAGGDRPDQLGDRGGEYRSLVGLPGGASSPLYASLVAANEAAGSRVSLRPGKGGDGDARGAVYVYDSELFPAHRAENYHQFHDGFARGEDYPASYNNIKNLLAAEGRLPETDCPFV